MNDAKAAAHLFLEQFEQALRANLPQKGAAMNPIIRSIVADARANDRGKKHLKGPEAAFLNQFVLPVLFRQIQEEAGLTEDQAKDALLNEYRATMPAISRYSPIHPIGHPFRKALGASPEAVYRQWRYPEKGDGLTQSCPDFALRSPFPHSIIFEGKYFASGLQPHAAKQLATDIYQAFFYRGLPRVAASRKGKADWDYDYACLLALDASPNGTFKAAWDDLSAKIRKSFWDSANIYVMIIRD